MAHSRVGARSFGRSLIRSDGFVPHAQTREDVRWHVQRMRHPRRNRIISSGRGQSTLGEMGIIVAMDQVMNHAGMVWVLFPQLFQDGSCLQLFRQTGVAGCRITDCQHREGVEGLGFEIVRILVPELANCFFVGHHSIAWSDRSMTRLSNRACSRTVRCIVIDIQRPDESSLAVRAGVHRHRFFDGRFTRAHFIGSRWRPNRMPPRHGDSPLSHRAFRVALGHRSKNASRLFVKKRMEQRHAASKV